MKTKKANGSILEAAVWTAVVWIAVMLLGGLLAALVNAEWIGTSAAKRVLALLSLPILFLACWLTAKRMSKGRLLISFGMAILYVLLGMGTALLIGENGFGIRVMWPLAVGLLAGVASGKKTRRRR